ncbi:hypothetical protein [Reyranella sp.]|uniref:hypothetical protein n=1 Tax=Reyranella sp. TaxID=1929291 RepID=UPI003D14F600
MFVRFRATASRLQLSLIETRRADGKVKHEHVASLGSIVLDPDVAARIAFWAGLHQRLAKLSNRIDAATFGSILGSVHARVPMVTPDEQRALQLENAKAEAEQWAAVRDFTASDAADKREFANQADITAQKAADAAAALGADEAAKKAQARVEAIERGETVEGGLTKRQPLRDLLKAMGWTAADQRHADLLAKIPEEHFDDFVAESVRLNRKGERSRSTKAAQTILRKHGAR